MESGIKISSPGKSDPSKDNGQDCPDSSKSPKKPIVLGVVQSSMGGKVNIGNLIRKRRWDQPPEDEDKGQTSNVKTEKDSTVNLVKSDAIVDEKISVSKTNVKDLINKFEDISENVNKHPLDKELQNFEEKIEDSTSSCPVSLENASLKSTQRVKLVRPKLNVLKKPEDKSIGNMPKINPDKNIVELGNQEIKNVINRPTESTPQEISAEPEKSYSEESPQLKSTALMMISSYDDSPSEDSLPEIDSESIKDDLIEKVTKVESVLESVDDNSKNKNKKTENIRNSEKEIRNTDDIAWDKLEETSVASKQEMVLDEPNSPDLKSNDNHSIEEEMEKMFEEVESCSEESRLLETSSMKEIVSTGINIKVLTSPLGGSDNQSESLKIENENNVKEYNSSKESNLVATKEVLELNKAENTSENKLTETNIVSTEKTSNVEMESTDLHKNEIARDVETIKELDIVDSASKTILAETEFEKQLNVVSEPVKLQGKTTGLELYQDKLEKTFDLKEKSRDLLTEGEIKLDKIAEKSNLNFELLPKSVANLETRQINVNSTEDNMRPDKKGDESDDLSNVVVDSAVVEISKNEKDVETTSNIHSESLEKLLECKNAVGLEKTTQENVISVEDDHLKTENASDEESGLNIVKEIENLDSNKGLTTTEDIIDNLNTENNIVNNLNIDQISDIKMTILSEPETSHKIETQTDVTTLDGVKSTEIVGCDIAVKDSGEFEISSSDNDIVNTVLAKTELRFNEDNIKVISKGNPDVVDIQTSKDILVDEQCLENPNIDEKTEGHVEECEDKTSVNTGIEDNIDELQSEITNKRKIIIVEESIEPGLSDTLNELLVKDHEEIEQKETISSDVLFAIDGSQETELHKELTEVVNRNESELEEKSNNDGESLIEVENIDQNKITDNESLELGVVTNNSISIDTDLGFKKEDCTDGKEVEPIIVVQLTGGSDVEEDGTKNEIISSASVKSDENKIFSHEEHLNTESNTLCDNSKVIGEDKSVAGVKIMLQDSDNNKHIEVKSSDRVIAAKVERREQSIVSGSGKSIKTVKEIQHEEIDNRDNKILDDNREKDLEQDVRLVATEDELKSNLGFVQLKEVSAAVSTVFKNDSENIKEDNLESKECNDEINEAESTEFSKSTVGNEEQVNVDHGTKTLKNKTEDTGESEVPQETDGMIVEADNLADMEDKNTEIRKYDISNPADDVKENVLLVHDNNEELKTTEIAGLIQEKEIEKTNLDDPHETNCGSLVEDENNEDNNKITIQNKDHEEEKELKLVPAEDVIGIEGKEIVIENNVQIEDIQSISSEILLDAEVGQNNQEQKDNLEEIKFIPSEIVISTKDEPTEEDNSVAELQEGTVKEHEKVESDSVLNNKNKLGVELSDVDDTRLEIEQIIQTDSTTTIETTDTIVDELEDNMEAQTQVVIKEVSKNFDQDSQSKPLEMCNTDLSTKETKEDEIKFEETHFETPILVLEDKITIPERELAEIPLVKNISQTKQSKMISDITVEGDSFGNTANNETISNSSNLLKKDTKENFIKINSNEEEQAGDSSKIIEDKLEIKSNDYNISEVEEDQLLDGVSTNLVKNSDKESVTQINDTDLEIEQIKESEIILSDSEINKIKFVAEENQQPALTENKENLESVEGSTVDSADEDDLLNISNLEKSNSLTSLLEEKLLEEGSKETFTELLVPNENANKEEKDKETHKEPVISSENTKKEEKDKETYTEPIIPSKVVNKEENDRDRCTEPIVSTENANKEENGRESNTEPIVPTEKATTEENDREILIEPIISTENANKEENGRESNTEPIVPTEKATTEENDREIRTEPIVSTENVNKEENGRETHTELIVPTNKANKEENDKEIHTEPIVSTENVNKEKHDREIHTETIVSTENVNKEENYRKTHEETTVSSENANKEGTNKEIQVESVVSSENANKEGKNKEIQVESVVSSENSKKEKNDRKTHAETIVSSENISKEENNKEIHVESIIASDNYNKEEKHVEILKGIDLLETTEAAVENQSSDLKINETERDKINEVVSIDVHKHGRISQDETMQENITQSDLKSKEVPEAGLKSYKEGTTKDGIAQKKVDYTVKRKLETSNDDVSKKKRPIESMKNLHLLKTDETIHKVKDKLKIPATDESKKQIITETKKIVNDSEKLKKTCIDTDETKEITSPKSIKGSDKVVLKESTSSTATKNTPTSENYEEIKTGTCASLENKTKPSSSVEPSAGVTVKRKLKRPFQSFAEKAAPSVAITKVCKTVQSDKSELLICKRTKLDEAQTSTEVNAKVSNAESEPTPENIESTSVVKNIVNEPNRQTTQDIKQGKDSGHMSLKTKIVLKKPEEHKSTKTVLDSVATETRSLQPTRDMLLKSEKYKGITIKPIVIPPEQTAGLSIKTDMKSPKHSPKSPMVITSPKRVEKELPQAKLEPITLKLSKDNPVIMRSQSLSPKKSSESYKIQDSKAQSVSPQSKTLGYTLKIGKDSTQIIPKDISGMPTGMKSSEFAKVEHLFKNTGLTITPVVSQEQQESQKLNKITLKLSKAGGHPEIKCEDQCDTWKTVNKMPPVDLAMGRTTISLTQGGSSVKRKDSVESHISEKKMKQSEPECDAGPSSKLQGLLTKVLPMKLSDPSSSSTIHVINVVSPNSAESKTPTLQTQVGVGVMKQQIPGVNVPRKRGRPRKVIPPVIPGSSEKQIVSSGTSSGPNTGESMFPVPLFNLSDPFMEADPQNVFPGQVQPSNGRPQRSCRGRIKLPVVRTRKPRGGGILRGVTRGRGRGRGRGMKQMLAEMMLMGKMRSAEDIKKHLTSNKEGIMVKQEIKQESSIQQEHSNSSLQDTTNLKSIENFESLNPNKILSSSSSSTDNIASTDSSISEKVTSLLPDVVPSAVKTSEEEVKVLSEIKIEPGLKVSELDLKRIRNTNKGKQIRLGKVKRLTVKEKKERREAKRLAQRAKAAAAALAKPPPPQMFEEETRMSATESNSRAQTPARTGSGENPDESMGSVGDQTNTSIRNKKGRMEVIDLESGKELTVDQIAEYQWPLQGGELYMIQEQISNYLGVKSFKRKYPDLKRRQVEPEERTFLCDSGLVTESMCDLGLTAVSSAEVLDIMYQDFQDKYEDFRKHMREKQAKEMTNKQKAEKKKAEQGQSKMDTKEQAMQSAISWNQALNKARTETRRCALDLQTWTIQFPQSRRVMMTKPLPKLGNYPLALIPGQYADYYRGYTPQELRYFPINTVLYGPMRPNERQVIVAGGSDGSQSESEDSSSSDDSSDSSSDGEGTEEEEKDVVICKLCGHDKNKIKETPGASCTHCSSTVTNNTSAVWG